jgi:hypothetical protein
LPRPPGRDIGVHEHGCGFEAQNEAWYRFLVQPDPFDHVTVSGGRASLVDYDQVILQRRAAFLRPDSLLAIIVVTDENEQVANPLSVGGQGSLYATPTTGAYATTQINGNADPSVREMAIAQATAESTAGVQGIVSSLCPIHTSFAGGAALDPLYGYRPAVNAIIDRLKTDLSAQCLPQQLTVGGGAL